MPRPTLQHSQRPSTIASAPAVTGAALVPVPVPAERNRSQKTSSLTSVQLCPALGARSPPRPAEREQEVEEKNRHSRCRDASEPPPPLPTLCVAQVEAKPEAAGPLPGSATTLVLPGKEEEGKQKFRSCFFPPTHNVCSLRQCGFPGADLKAAVQKKHMAIAESRRHCSAPANLESCWVNPGSHYLKFMAFSFLSF